MKRIVLIALIALGFTAAQAQKFAYVDTKYILNQIPEYGQAQEQLKSLTQDWQKEIDAVFAEADQMRKDFQMEKILLTEEMQQERKRAIEAKEKEARDLQQKYFGPDGELFKKRKELIKPLQDQVFNAIADLADRGGYAIIFDKSSDLMMLYTDPKYDRSDQILRQLGY
jgi:outer membrane protein